MNPAGLLLVACGVLAICGAGYDWEWFMNHHKARFFIAIFGRKGARTFYRILGAGLMIPGVLITAGIIQDKH